MPRLSETLTELWHQPMRGPKVLLFSHVELACPATGIVRLADGFAVHLVDLRVAFGQPMRVNSCCRSEVHNKAIGGHPHSLHVFDHPHHPINGTAAIDIATPDGPARARLARLAWLRGWSVGRGHGFLHLDCRHLAGLAQARFSY